jgi:hypothetical protein
MQKVSNSVANLKHIVDKILIFACICEILTGNSQAIRARNKGADLQPLCS